MGCRTMEKETMIEKEILIAFGLGTLVGMFICFFTAWTNGDI